MTNHSTKITRARRLSAIGRYPASFAAMLDALPQCAIEGLSSKRLAELLDAMWSLAQASKQVALDDAARSGELWGQGHLCDVKRCA